jgi:hypothetical protein
MVGADAWWLDPVLSIWKTDWHRRFGEPFDLSNYQDVHTGYILKSIFAGRVLKDVNNQEWSDDQLSLLAQAGVDVNEALARRWRDQVITKAIQCLGHPTVTRQCDYAISWTSDPPGQPRP